MTKEQTNSWVEDFDKAWFQWEIVEQNCSWGSVDSDALVSFFKDYLSKTFSQEKEKWTKEVEALEPYYHPQPDNESMFRAYQSGYNKAREEILDLLKNK